MTARAWPARVAMAVLAMIATAGGTVAVVGVAACGGGTQEIRRDSSAFYDTGQFAAHTDEHLSLADAPQATTATPAVDGRVIFVDADSGTSTGCSRCRW